MRRLRVREEHTQRKLSDHDIYHQIPHLLLVGRVIKNILKTEFNPLLYLL